MASEIIMPRVDMDMAEGKIAYWYVKNGDTVTKGQPLFDIETDKATMEVEAHVDGTVQGICGEVGVMMPVGTVVAWLLAEGESLPEEAAVPEPSPAAPAPTTVTAHDTSAPLRATPLARSMARAQQIDLRHVAGSGPAGRIVAADLQGAARSLEPSHVSGPLLHTQWLCEGAGAPLVLLHGFGADHGSFKPLAAHMPGQAALAIDLPGHGKSPAQTPRSLGDLAQRVLQTLDAMGISDFHLLGHSLGGGVALAVAQQAGSRIRSLTLLAPAGLGPDINGAFIEGLCRAESEASLRPWMAELVSDPQLLSGSFIATAHKQLASDQRRAALRSLAHSLMPQGTQAESLRHVLEQLKVPAKVIWGSDDRIIPARHGANLPGQVGLHLLRGVGHLPYVEQPQLVAQLVAEQLR
jgi:pimeloyl-ACP methyl ester carboxylesterase